MTVNAGDIVMLKSGGQPLTVASVSSEEAVCLWIGEEGDLFREAIPLVALTSFDMEDGGEGDDDHDDEDEDEEDDAEGAASDDEEEEEEDEPARKRVTA